MDLPKISNIVCETGKWGKAIMSSDKKIPFQRRAKPVPTETYEIGFCLPRKDPLVVALEKRAKEAGISRHDLVMRILREGLGLSNVDSMLDSSLSAHANGKGALPSSFSSKKSEAEIIQFPFPQATEKGFSAASPKNL